MEKIDRKWTIGLSTATVLLCSVALMGAPASAATAPSFGVKATDGKNTSSAGFLPDPGASNPGPGTPGAPGGPGTPETPETPAAPLITAVVHSVAPAPAGDFTVVGSDSKAPKSFSLQSTQDPSSVVRYSPSTKQWELGAEDSFVAASPSSNSGKTVNGKFFVTNEGRDIETPAAANSNAARFSNGDWLIFNIYSSKIWVSSDLTNWKELDAPRADSQSRAGSLRFNITSDSVIWSMSNFDSGKTEYEIWTVSRG